MTQFIEPNKHSDLVADRVLDWLQAQRTGLLEGFEVTPGASGFLLNIASGRIVVKGTTVYDDLTRIDSTVLSTALTPPLGSDTHALVYGTYTAADTFPPAAMTISVATTTGSPPTPPSLPVDSVKFADIFMPSSATDLSASTIINAPKMPDRGTADGDVLIERVVSSNLNVFIAGGGYMSYGAGTFAWTEAIDVFSTNVTHKEKFMTAPLAVGQIAASSVGSVGDNSILFVVFDRTVLNDIGSPVALTMRVLDLDSPDLTEMSAFFDPTTRDNIVWIAMTVGGTVITRGGVGTGLPPPVGAEPPARFLRQDPTGAGAAHTWSTITEDLIVSILSISAFSATSPTKELGDIVDTPAFTATVINDGGDGPSAAQLTNDFNVEDKNVVAGFGGTSNGSFSSDQTGYVKTATGANGQVVFTLTADDGDTPDTDPATINWYRYHYWGFNATDPGSGSYDNTFLKTTIQADQGGQSLRSGRGATMSESAPSAAKYFFFAYPAWKGAVTSIIDNTTGFEVLSAFTQVDAAQAGITTENAAAIAENYRVYRSLVQQTGLVNITVS